METCMVSSIYTNISQEPFGGFEKNTKGIISKLTTQIGYNGQGIGKRKQGIVNPIIVEYRTMRGVLHAT